MSVYLCMPSARPDGGTISQWQAAGYKTAIWRDPSAAPLSSDILIEAKYPGYYKACNLLIREALKDQECNWVVCAGDDTLPDPKHTPNFIAAQCCSKFVRFGPLCPEMDNTFGVMQPTGDPWSDLKGRIIERIAGSPWIGRTFAERAYGGNGPYCEEYWHMGGDEELQCVARNLGVFWQRPDLNHRHNHWARQPGHTEADMPAFLRRANSQAEWANFLSVFESRKAHNFPGHEVRG